MKGTVNVCDYHGNMIATYEGEIENISRNGIGVSFLYDGKQVVICNGIVIIEEE
mgnify:CR=1 FL=1